MVELDSAVSRSPYYVGFTTLNSETSIPKLSVRGVIPEWLSGALVRTGPARFESRRHEVQSLV